MSTSSSIIFALVVASAVTLGGIAADNDTFVARNGGDEHASTKGRLARDDYGQHHQHHRQPSSVYGAPAGNFDLSPSIGGHHHHQQHYQPPLSNSYQAPPSASLLRPSPGLLGGGGGGGGSYSVPSPSPSHHHHGSYAVPGNSRPSDGYGLPPSSSSGYPPTVPPKPFDVYSPPETAYNKPPPPPQSSAAPSQSYGPPLTSPLGMKPGGYPGSSSSSYISGPPSSPSSSPSFDPYGESLDSDPWALPSGGLGAAAAAGFLGSFDALHHHPHHSSHFFRVPDQVYREKYQFDKFYIAGTEAYLAAKWHDCVEQMNKAMAAYKAYKWVEVKCRGLCKGEVWKDKVQQQQQQQQQQNFLRGGYGYGGRPEVNVTFPGSGTTPRPSTTQGSSATASTATASLTTSDSSAGSTTSQPPTPSTSTAGPKPPPVIEQEFHYDAIAELQTFDSLLHETLCINKCKASKLGPVAYHRFKKDVVHHFHELRPYDYLQLCYYKTENYQRAASCAYTFLVAHPGHDVMSSNLQYYSTLHQVNPGYVFNLEAQSYAKLYMRGTRAYTSKRYEDVVEYMEESLAEYLRTEENCKLTCEDALDYHTDGPLKSAVADSILESLRCKQDCPRRLSNLYGDFQDEFLASHFHYLQFAYYHLNDLKKACEATETYLLLQPYDQTMKYNKEFYGGLPDVDPSFFTPRKDIREYHEQDELERSILESMRDGLGKDWTYKSYRSAPAVGGHERFGVSATEFIRRQGQVGLPTSPASSSDEPEDPPEVPADHRNHHHHHHEHHQQRKTYQQQQQQTEARNFYRRRGNGRSLGSGDGPTGPSLSLEEQERLRAAFGRVVVDEEDVE